MTQNPNSVCMLRYSDSRVSIKRSRGNHGSKRQQRNIWFSEKLGSAAAAYLYGFCWKQYTVNIAFMEEQFILRVPPSVAERIEHFLNENPSSFEDKSLDLSFSAEDGRSGTFIIGNDHFPASLLDLPCVVESYKTYDDSCLIKTADIGQMIMVREAGDATPDVIEYRHGLTPPMRDARKRRFRREPDLNPELVSRVEKDLLKIMAGGTADNVDVEAAEQEEEGDENARGASKKPAPPPVAKDDVPETVTNAGEPDSRSDSEESDDSV